jgi:hypothetical protein
MKIDESNGSSSDPEQLYDNLQQFFPKVDLDKPIVEPVSTTKHLFRIAPQYLGFASTSASSPRPSPPGAILASSSKDPEGTVKARPRCLCCSEGCFQQE